MVNGIINTDLKVLIVDDSEIMLAVLSGVLEDFGFNPLTNIYATTDVKIALSTLHNYDLVLTDINMPIHDGYDIAQYAKHEAERYKKKIYVFAISGSDINQILNDKTKDHTIFDEILIKPINNAELEKLIAEI